jgi:uncharacterized protein YbjT (DUF2867 family)
VRALDGATRLFVASAPHPEMDIREIRLIQAAREKGIRSLLKISGSDGLVGPRSRSLTMRQHYASEEELRGSGLQWAILRPSAFIQTLMEQIAPFVRDRRRFGLPGGEHSFSFIDVRDIGEVAATLLSGDANWNAVHVLTGPEVLRYDEIADSLGRTLGNPVTYRPQSLFFARLAINQQVHYHHARNQLADLAATIRGGISDHPTDTVDRILGRPPRSVRAWIEEHRDQFMR